MKHFKENKILKQEALEVLKDKWEIAVLAGVLYIFISFLASKALFIFSVLISAPLMVGVAMFYLALSRGETPEVFSIFKYFNNRFATYLFAYVISIVKIILWSILLIVPGIIAALAYSQLFFILAEDNSIKANEAIEKSKKLMMGNKWKYFKLVLSFIGWFILSVLTFGLGFFLLIPYVYVAQAKFYDDLKKHHN